MTSTLKLPAEAGSIPVARCWLAGELSDVGGEPAQVAALLLSELVTNAVIHAGTELELHASRQGSRLRVEVADSSHEAPTIKHYGEDAITGRGLLLVSKMASAWGVEYSKEGKVVWFEIGGPAGRPGGPLSYLQASFSPASGLAGDVVGRSTSEPGQLTKADGPWVDLVSIEVLQLPLPLYVRTSAQYDALTREFRLISECSAGERRMVPADLQGIIEEVGTRFSIFTQGPEGELRRALERGDSSIDLHYRVPRDIGEAVLRLDQVLDEADTFCRVGVDLLTLAPGPGAVAFRKWLLGEFVDQSDGKPPIPWLSSEWARKAVPRGPADGKVGPAT